MNSTRRGPLPWWGAGMDVVAGLVVLILAWQMVLGSIGARISFGEEPEEPKPSEITQYWVLAGLIFAILVFGLVIAVLQNRVPAMAAYPFILLFTLAVVLFFSVPQITPAEDPVYPRNPNGCYDTASENCPGG